ncbi:alpha/beta hydrolase, partial [Xanthovirga aplysinae]|uniref:alpha/beta hydrolase n=1 Tax=Xanthovirga aplysinae TaxID=2529853 RepID=UPI0012BC473A
MKLYLFLLRSYYTILSILWPSLAAKRAFFLFQKPQKKAFRKNELGFYQKAKHFKVSFHLEDIDCYELGNSEGELVFLVHGWESNAGSLSAIGFDLVKEGYRVIALNLPGHGYSKLKHTNLIICKEALLKVINEISPKDPFSVVAHSFGSAVSTFALSESNYKIRNLILLTTPNQIERIFLEFKNIIHLGDSAYQKLLDKVHHVLGYS